VEVIVDFIDDHKEELGVEPVCKELQVAPSTYYATKARPPSARVCRGRAGDHRRLAAVMISGPSSDSGRPSQSPNCSTTARPA
jgi:hypothetical protein